MQVGRQIIWCRPVGGGKDKLCCACVTSREEGARCLAVCSFWAFVFLLRVSCVMLSTTPGTIVADRQLQLPSTTSHLWAAVNYLQVYIAYLVVGRPPSARRDPRAIMGAMRSLIGKKRKQQRDSRLRGRTPGRSAAPHRARRSAAPLRRSRESRCVIHRTQMETRRALRIS
jgi:hypothetical protein